MKLHAVVALIVLPTLCPIVSRAQVRAGSPELKLYEQIDAEMNPDAKLDLVRTFENQFPSSKILGRVYLIAVDVYRAKQDRSKINEYGEKALKADGGNMTAMMLLARNYAIEANNLDRAMELAQRALERTKQLSKEPIPTGYSVSLWEDYLRSNSASAQQILDYVSSIKRRSEDFKSSASKAVTTNPNSTPANDQKQ